MNTKLTWMRVSLVLARALAGIVQAYDCSFGYEDELEIANIVLRSANIIQELTEMEDEQ